MFTKETYTQRRNQLKNKINSGIALILGNCDSPMNYPSNAYHFRQDSNFLYFFGINHPDMAGVIDFDNGIEYLFANDVDMDDIIWMGPQPSVKEKAAQIGIEHTESFNALSQFIQQALQKGRKIHYLPPYRAENKILLSTLLTIPIPQLKENASIELIKGVVALRSIKEDCEIIEIEKACNIGYIMHTTAMKMAHAGVIEQEIAGTMEGISLSYGNTPSFPIILTINGQTLHNHYHGNILKEGRMMLIDAGSQTNMFYASDNTRTVPVGGKFSQRQKDIYQIVLQAIDHGNSIIQPGTAYRDVHLSVCKTIANGLKNLGLMKGNISEAVDLGAHALFMPHGLGHMMGLDVHDMEDLGENYVGYDDDIKRSDIFGTAFLRLGKKLQEGFVMTNEPGIYFIPELIDLWKSEKKFSEYINYDIVETYKDFGGIRLEDDILVTHDGCKILGDKRIPITVDEIEALMAK